MTAVTLVPQDRCQLCRHDAHETTVCRLAFCDLASTRLRHHHCPKGCYCTTTGCMP